MNKWSCFGDSAPNFSFISRSYTSTYIILALESSIARKLDFILPRCLLIHLFRTWWITRSTGSQSSLHMDTYCCALVLPRSHVDTGRNHDADLFLIPNEIYKFSRWRCYSSRGIIKIWFIVISELPYIVSTSTYCSI